MIDKTVYIAQKNAVYAKIICEDFDFIVMLRKKFSFRPEGYQFSPAYKRKSWDGWFRMFDVDGKIYSGLWKDVYNFCIEQGQPVKVDPKYAPNVLPMERFKGFIETLMIHSDGQPIPPYSYQLDAAHHALQHRGCILLSPTSSGKSLIQYIVIRALEKMNGESNTLIVVPTVGLVTQMTADFADYSSEIEWNADEKIHGIMAGVDKNTDKHIIISTFQSIAKQPRSFFEKFNNVMVDEVHRATSKSLTKILEKCYNSVYRIGLTGTLDDCKTHEMILKGLFGPIKNVITTHELMEQEKVAQLSVCVIRFSYDDSERKFMRSAPRGPINPQTDKQDRKKANYLEEIGFITNHTMRNEKVVKLASKLDGNTIVMVNQLDHVDTLYEKLKSTGKEVYIYTGKVKKVERERIRQLVEKKDGVIILGTLGVLSTGISIKRLKNLIFAHPTKAKIKTLQSVGRILRKSKYGNDVRLYDIVDDFRIGAYENYTYEHGMLRISYYDDQKFRVFYKEINIDKM